MMMLSMNLFVNKYSSNSHDKSASKICHWKRIDRVISMHMENVQNVLFFLSEFMHQFVLSFTHYLTTVKEIQQFLQKFS
jgi:hypothetical protein